MRISDWSSDVCSSDPLAINTAEKTRYMHDFALRYPTPYRDTMLGYVRDNQLDEAWVYGLIRQESRFVSQARSHVGASGLMQVRSEESRVGKEWVITFRSWWVTDHSKKKINNST